MLLLTVVALMMVMLAMSVAPAFAKGPPGDVNIAYYHACNAPPASGPNPPPAHPPEWCP